MASKIVKENVLDPYDGNDSILFDISKCRWLLRAGSGVGGGGLRPQTPFFTYFYIYTFWNQKLCIYNFLCQHDYVFSNKAPFKYFFSQY